MVRPRNTEPRDVVLLDGGMGQELVRRSGEPPTPLWSAEVLHRRPELVRALHVDFIASGARVITLASYPATRERLAARGLAERFEPLQRAAIDAARAARDDAGVDGVAIAGCLPPLAGSYRPDLAPAAEAMRESYRRTVELQARHVDLFVCETMASIAEARAAVGAALESGKPVWLALTLDDRAPERLRSGELARDAVTALGDLGASALLFNCSRPETIAAGWRALDGFDGPPGAFANAFEAVDALSPDTTVDGLRTRDDVGPERYASWCLERVDAGARIVGGCCGVAPVHIAAVRDALERAGHRLVAAVEPKPENPA